MLILERIVHQIDPDKWPEVMIMEAEFDQVEKPFGFTEKKRFRTLIAEDGVNTLVIERNWPSMAALEAAYDKASADPGWQAIGMKWSTVIKDTRYELFLVLQ